VKVRKVLGCVRCLLFIGGGLALIYCAAVVLTASDYQAKARKQVKTVRTDPTNMSGHPDRAWPP